MLKDVWSYIFSVYWVVQQAIFSGPFPESLQLNASNLQKHLGKWYFKAAASHRLNDIQQFSEMDNMWFTIEEIGDTTLRLAGHMRIADNCVNQNWTYHIRPGRDDLELEGRTQRRNLLWTGSWANCKDCFVLQETEPPLSPTDSVDSLSRVMLYARQSEVDSAVVKTFLKNAAANNLVESLTIPQKKEYCT